MSNVATKRPTFEQVMATTKAQARPYQERVITTAVDNFCNTTIGSQLINSPTGSGKTVMGMVAAAWMQKTHNIGVGWCAMRRNLLTQASASNLALELGVDCLTTISMFDKNPPTHDAKGRKIDLLVVDEAQHDAADSMGHLHNTIEPRWVLGLSATPFRTDKLKLCFSKVLRDAGIHQLIQQGYLAPYHQYTIPTWNVETVVKHYLAEPETWGKSVMYWVNSSYARDCLNQLEEAGVRVAFIHGAMTIGEREAILARFDESVYGSDDPEHLDVLVNMHVLTEGWDCCSLKTAWVRDSSHGCTVQMAGRVFRPSPLHKHKQIVQSKGTRWPIQKTAKPDMAYIWMEAENGGDDAWRTIKPSEVTNKVANAALLTLAHTNTKMPEYLLKRKEKRRNIAGESGLGPRPEGGGAFIHD